LYLNHSQEVPAAFHLQLAVAHAAGDPAGTAYQQPPAHSKLTFIEASDVGLFHLGPAFREPTRLGNLNGSNPMKPYPGITLDHEPVAIGDLAR
jgi:hypothetical protein